MKQISRFLFIILSLAVVPAFAEVKQAVPKTLLLQAVVQDDGGNVISSEIQEANFTFGTREFKNRITGAITGLIDRLFKRQEPRKQPEDYYDITVTDKYIRVEHPKRKTEQINWNDIDEITVVTTDEGPFLPDVWLVLIGKDSGCSLPQGAPKYDEVYDIISKYDGFNFGEYIKAASCTENARFGVWKRNN